MAKFHKLHAPVILAGSVGDAENDIMTTSLYDVVEEEKSTTNKGLQW